MCCEKYQIVTPNVNTENVQLKTRALHCMPLTNYFREFLHNVVLALALWDVTDEKTAIGYGRIHLQLFPRSDLVTIQL